MISTISLNNFKSFVQTGTITLRPITIFSGQNSSGKSTLIQALLMLKQTLASPMLNESLVLNGSLVSLGTYDDVLNFSADGGDGFKLTVGFELNRKPTDASWRLRRYFQKPGNILLEMKFIGDDSDSSRSMEMPRLEMLSMHGVIDNNEFSVQLQNDKALYESLSKKFNMQQSQIPAANDALYSVLKCNKIAKPEAVVLRSFLPQAILTPFHKEKIDEQNRILDEFISTLARTILPDSYQESVLSLNEHYFSDRRWETVVHRISMLARRHATRAGKNIQTPSMNEHKKRCLEFLEEILSDRNVFRDVRERRVLEDVLSYLSQEVLSDIADSLKESVGTIKHYSQLPQTLKVEPVSRWQLLDCEGDLGDANAIVGHCLENVFYLGPLREEPKAFYQRLGSPDPMYVGQRGENVAFVLKYYSNRTLTAIVPPEASVDWNPIGEQATQVPLGVAVNRWLRYLGIARQIRIEEMGKIGLTIKAKIHDVGEADLTNVGVGVSQIVPIIVLGLASPDDATLIFEQPELHLHPYVQSRLADFFVSLSRIGKQVIAETHSEHLIHRIRLHIAKGDLHNEKDVAVYFCEVENGKSEINHVVIDEFGAIEKWPKGFFDETSKQLDEILTAAINRAEMILNQEEQS